MCRYCENLVTIMTDFEYGHGIESEKSRSTFAHVARDPKTNKFYFEIDESYIYCFKIEFCPMCGRKFNT